MILTFEDIVRSTFDQMLSALTAMQQGSIEAMHAWMRAASPLLPDLNVYHEMPTMLQDMLGNPEAIMEESYNFALEVLKLQREFLSEVFNASMVAPRTPYVPRKGFVEA